MTWLRGTRIARLGALLLPVAGAMLVSLLLLSGSEPAYAAELTVDNTSDNGFLSACTGAPNDCSLRGALLNANGTAAPDYISFNDLGSPGVPATIAPPSNPLIVSQPLFIDGLNSAGGSIIINGGGRAFSGLLVFADNVTILGLRINNFNGNGIHIGDATNVLVSSSRISLNSLRGIEIDSSEDVTIFNTVVGSNGGDGILLASNTENVTIKASYIGLGAPPAGGDTGNGGDGIQVDGNSHFIGVGGNADDRNYISGNFGFGVNVVGGSGTSIEGNFIGTNFAGTAAVLNDFGGIRVEGAQGTVVGGSAGLTPTDQCAGDCNLISGNGVFGGSGVSVSESVDTTIVGNFIGTDVSGTAAVSNGSAGVSVSQSQGTVIGSNNRLLRNLISGNGRNGVSITRSLATDNVVVSNTIGMNIDATAALPNGSSGIYVAAPGNRILGNLISGNIGRGIFVNDDALGASGGTVVPAGSIPVDPDNNEIRGNYIGVGGDGSLAIPNTEAGIELNGATGTTIGGTSAISRNVIAGNGGPGLFVSEGSQGTQVLGNHIGITIVAGTEVAVANNGDGIHIHDSPGNTVGGTGTARNVISGNVGEGVHITGTSAGNTVAGNYLGTGLSGLTDVGNGENGVRIEDAPGTTIGGPSSGLRNVISGNEQGIIVRGVTAVGTVIQGNFIGTNATGTAAVGNDVHGIFVDNGAADTLIGGATAGTGNVVSGNRFGISLDDDLVDSTVQGNFIGTDATGDGPLGNEEHGLLIHEADNSQIGGLGAAANIIAFNGLQGIRVDHQSTGADMQGNAVHSNGGLGIDLRASGDVANTVTPNDGGDADIGGNNLQNFPLIDSVISASEGFSIQGSLNSGANRQYRLDFYVNPDCDPSGNGEGENYLGFLTVVTNAAGNVGFLATSSGFINVGREITATATDLASGDTSEFSACETVVAGVPVTPTPTPPGQTPTPSPTPDTSATPTGSPTATPTPTGDGTPTPTPTSSAEGIVWGDNNCSGDADPIDALLELRFDAGLSTNTGECPALGEDVTVDGEIYAWGDVDCNGSVGPVDGLKLLRHDSGLSVAQEDGCPGIGEGVVVS